MTIKFQAAANLKPPPVCRKTPPWPIPTRLARGLLCVHYSYEAKPYDQDPIKNVGIDILTPTGDNSWINDASLCGPGQPAIELTYDPETDTYDLNLQINFSIGVGIVYDATAIPAPTAAPFHLDIRPIMEDDPYWQWGISTAQVDPL